MSERLRWTDDPEWGPEVEIPGLPGSTFAWNVSEILAEQWGYACFIDDPELPVQRSADDGTGHRIVPTGSLVLAKRPEPGWDHDHCAVQSCWQKICRNKSYGQPMAWHAQRANVWICCSCHDALLRYRDELIAGLRERKGVLVAERRESGIPIDPAEHWLL